MNSLMMIFPYKFCGQWMFDDAAAGLNGEPLIAGMPEIIEYTTKKAGIKNPEGGFALTFSATPFPGHQAILQWSHEGEGGNYYKLEGTDMQGWACPALFKYFATAPKSIYCALSEKKAA